MAEHAAAELALSKILDDRESQMRKRERAMEAIEHPAPRRGANMTGNRASSVTQAEEAKAESLAFLPSFFPFPRLHTRDTALLVYQTKPLLRRSSRRPSLHTTVQIFGPTNPAAIQPTQASKYAELSGTFRWMQHGGGPARGDLRRWSSR
ncbi:hypothetical protein CPC08DRAFT_818653 [Agrocybe pediades]|nr:hypothetical protein CPC08DRAFT_818653 [Agrocybe pediades]